MPDQNKALGSADSTKCAKSIDLAYIATLVTQAIWVAPWPCIVTRIMGRPRVAGSGGACSLSFYKAASGVAVGSGTLLHSGTYDMVGTADINQELTLVANRDSLVLKEGDSIGYVLTGTATSAVGAVTVIVEPLS